MQGCSIVPEQLRCLGKNHNLLGGIVYSLDWTSTGLTQTAVRHVRYLIQGRTEVGTNSRNGAERNGTELRSKTQNSRGTLQFRSRWSKLAASVLRLGYCHETVRLVVLRIQKFQFGWGILTSTAAVANHSCVCNDHHQWMSLTAARSLRWQLV